MDRPSEKLDLIHWLVNTTDQKLIDELIAWRKEKEKQSILDYNRELDQANSEIDNGSYVSHKEAKVEIRSWREK